MSSGKFEIFLGQDEQYYFRLRAANSQTIFGSEGYVDKSGCKNGIDSVKVNAPSDERYRRETAVNGQHYFVLTAPNNQVIGKSQMYTAAASCEKGIESVKANAPDAPVVDLT